ncbi:MAG TPA: helix-turn-helix domain-containing protein [Polyangia bacterium]|nr:helix-turn-helix domain-containing protein [Polyangia bacterium]
MPKKPPPESALFVRLPAPAASRLDRAAEELGMRKKDLVAGLVTRYLGGGGPAQGSYSFQVYDPPEVMNAEQAGQFLQIDQDTVIELAEAGKLPGRKLGGAAWRFSRAALVAWLAGPEQR